MISISSVLSVPLGVLALVVGWASLALMGVLAGGVWHLLASTCRFQRESEEGLR